jgi:hypothetical protein
MLPDDLGPAAFRDCGHATLRFYRGCGTAHGSWSARSVVSGASWLHVHPVDALPFGMKITNRPGLPKPIGLQYRLQS